MKTLPPHLATHSAQGLVVGEPIAQFEIGPLKNFIYLVIDWHSPEKVAWVVDPQADLAAWSVGLEKHGIRLGGILLTHTHHDHVAGVPALVQKYPGIRIFAGARDFHRLRPETLKTAKVEAMRDGHQFQMGALTVQALETPGHSAGEICYFLEATEAHPPYLLTGDTVFIRDCGRTDFPDGSNEEMFASLRKISQLPSATVILPGHHYQPETATTLERELRESPPLRCRSVAELASLP